MIKHKFKLGKSFQEILCRIHNWINERFGQIVESVKSQYINISTFRPLIRSSYIKLIVELRSSKKRTNQYQKQQLKMFSLVSY